ncbi:reverse transcriptase [Phytophthora megakarya]|uniref:Reverse transcriptase n=1 Tax=Phytophthora megakarya TaxID=4795 RepID=A0A225UR53_9STRA|nr:reverse transcriptase [Phytophthora megakarya]
MTVFRRNIPAPSQMGPVLRRRSYIDDIARGASTWDQQCEDLGALLYRLRYWNISVSLPKRSLNYYNKFIEDLPVVAAVLYELDEERVSAGRNLEAARESFEILKRTKPFVIILHPNPWAACAVLGQEHEGLIHPVQFTGRVLKEPELRYHIAEKEVLAILRTLVVFIPLIHGSKFPVVVYTRYSVLKWLLQSNTADGRHLKWGLELSRWTLEIHRTQKDEDGLAAILGSGITPREHLDKVAKTLIPAKGRLKVTPPLSLETLEADYQGYVLSFDGAAHPRVWEHLNKVAKTLIPAKGRLKVTPPVSLETLEADYQGYVLSFDGAAKVSTRRGSCGCIRWKLPGWQVVKAQGHILECVTVNDAEYHGLILGLKLAMQYDVKELVAVGDSQIVVQQAQGLINCNQPNLQRRLAEYEDLRKNFVSVKLIHVKREFNQAADYLTSKALVLGESWDLDVPDEIVHLRLVSRITEKIMKPSEVLSTPVTDAVRSDQVELGTCNSKAEIPESLATAAEVHWW